MSLYNVTRGEFYLFLTKIKSSYDVKYERVSGEDWYLINGKVVAKVITKYNRDKFYWVKREV